MERDLCGSSADPISAVTMPMWYMLGAILNGRNRYTRSFRLLAVSPHLHYGGSLSTSGTIGSACGRPGSQQDCRGELRTHDATSITDVGGVDFPQYIVSICEVTSQARSLRVFSL